MKSIGVELRECDVPLYPKALARRVSSGYRDAVNGFDRTIAFTL